MDFPPRASSRPGSRSRPNSRQLVPVSRKSAIGGIVSRSLVSTPLRKDNGQERLNVEKRLEERRLADENKRQKNALQAEQERAHAEMVKRKAFENYQIQAAKRIEETRRKKLEDQIKNDEIKLQKEQADRERRLKKQAERRKKEEERARQAAEREKAREERLAQEAIEAKVRYLTSVDKDAEEMDWLEQIAEQMAEDDVTANMDAEMARKYDERRDREVARMFGVQDDPLDQFLRDHQH